MTVAVAPRRDQYAKKPEANITTSVEETISIPCLDDGGSGNGEDSTEEKCIMEVAIYLMGAGGL